MFDASDGYERYMGRWSRRLAPAFLDFTQARDGARFLDVGTGTGALAATVATTLKDGEVIGVDASEAFIAGAQHAAPPRVQFRVADAQALPFRHHVAVQFFDLGTAPNHHVLEPRRARGGQPRGGGGHLGVGGLVVAASGRV
jgi:SAM-dependent methyltransferase